MQDYTLDVSEKRAVWGRKYTVDTTSFTHGEPLPDDLAGDTCYTDGSKTNAGTGWAYTTTVEGRKHTGLGQLGPGATVFQAEVYAIRMAAEKLKDINCKNITFYSDSQSALQMLNGFFFNSLSGQACSNALNELGAGCEVTLRWVKAHIGHARNEEADQLAKAGTEEPLPGDHDLPLSKAFFRAELKGGLQQMWDERWDSYKNTNLYRQTRQFLPKFYEKISKDVCKLSRDKLSHVIQAITGHGYLHYHQFKLNRVDSPNCRWCEEEDETAWHIIHD